jgi:sulfatase modifying factor 1
MNRFHSTVVFCSKLLVLSLAVASARAQSNGEARPALLKSPFDRSTAIRAQDEWARYLRRAVAESSAKMGISLRLIPPGEFVMGRFETVDELKKMSSALDQELAENAGGVRDGIESERPQHRVVISKPFYMGTCNVTLSQFRRFVEETKYRTDAEASPLGGWGYTPDGKFLFTRSAEFDWKHTGFEQGEKQPVINVSWNDATAFCKWLSEKEAKKFRLPTEAEWEYACRAGSTTVYSFGNNPQELTKHANVRDKAYIERFYAAALSLGRQSYDFGLAVRTDDSFPFTSPVGQFLPNAFGLYDMHGNAEAWCGDVYADDYYSKAPISDPTGPMKGEYRVHRGGSWGGAPVACRSAARKASTPEVRCDEIGIRVVWEP